MKISGMRGFKKPRTLGEVFELDLDHPDQRAAYKHLLANGAIKPIGEASKVGANAQEREPVTEKTVLSPAPLFDKPPCCAEVGETEQTARTCKECAIFNTEDCVHDDPHADAKDRYCFVPVVETIASESGETIESYPVPEPEPRVRPEPIGPDTKLLYIFNLYHTEIDFLTEDQIDTLRRIGVETIADINTRTDQDLKSLQGIGKSKIRQLRDLYDRYGVE